MYEQSLERAGDVLARADEGPRLPHAVDDVRGVEAAAREVLRRRDAQRHRELPRSAPRRPSARTRAAIVWEGEPGDVAHAHVLRAPPRGRAPRRRARRPRRRSRAIASRSTWAWSPRPPSRCSRARASARRTRSSSAASLPTRSAIASTTAAPRCSSRRTARGAAATSSRSRRWPTTRSSRRRPSRRSSCSGASAHEHAPVAMKEGRDVWWDDLARRASRATRALALAKSPPAFDAEHPLFILYTSGSTGKPKGVLHTTAGYLAGAHVTTKYVFDLRDERSLLVHRRRRLGHRAQLHRLRPALVRRDVHDVRGRAELPRLGPLLAASSRSTASRSSTRRRPRSARSSAPATSGRRRPTSRACASSARVGEPINPEAWIWYHRVVGGGRCPIVDTWWQTETGSIMLTTLPGACFSKPGSTGLPFFGVDIAVVKDNGERVQAERRRQARHQASRGRRWCARSGATTSASAKRTGARCPACTSPATARAATRTATSGSSAASTTCSTSPAIASAPPRSRARSSSHPAVAEAAAVGQARRSQGPGARRLRHAQAGPRGGQGAEGRRSREHIDKEIGKFARPDADPLHRRAAEDAQRQDHAPPPEGRRRRARSRRRATRRRSRTLSVLAKLRADED